jgi:hypothetical protein
MNWLKAIAEASSHESLLAIVNDYLLHHPDDFWSWVPKDSRPTLVATVAELHGRHRKLSDDLGRATMPNIRMQDVCVFFVRASARALELEQRGQGRAESSNDGEGTPTKSGQREQGLTATKRRPPPTPGSAKLYPTNGMALRPRRPGAVQRP